MPHQIKHLPHSHSLIILLLLLLWNIPQISSSDICQDLLTSLQAKDQLTLKTFLSQSEHSHLESCFLDLTPKYFWAQNMSHIMIKFQFLNSADTSACGKVLSVNKQVSHEQIGVDLICTMGSMILHYKINLKTFMPLNYYQATWKEGHQNTIYFECMKSPNPFFWKRLYRDNQVPARKPRIWWKMIERYSQDLKDFIYDLQVQDEEEDISSYVKRSQKMKKSPWWDLYQPDSPIYYYCNQNNPFEVGSWMI